MSSRPYQEPWMPNAPPALQTYLSQQPCYRVVTQSEILRVEVIPDKQMFKHAVWKIVACDRTIKDFYMRMPQVDFVFLGGTGYHFCQPTDRGAMPDWCLETIASPSFWMQHLSALRGPYELVIEVEVPQTRHDSSQMYLDFPPGRILNDYHYGPHIDPLCKFRPRAVIPLKQRSNPLPPEPVLPSTARFRDIFVPASEQDASVGVSPSPQVSAQNPAAPQGQSLLTTPSRTPPAQRAPAQTDGVGAGPGTQEEDSPTEPDIVPETGPVAPQDPSSHDVPAPNNLAPLNSAMFMMEPPFLPAAPVHPAPNVSRPIPFGPVIARTPSRNGRSPSKTRDPVAKTWKEFASRMLHHANHYDEV